MGSSDAYISLTVETRKSSLGCEIYISKNKDLFNFLRSQQEEIEKEVGDKLEWVDAAIASRIVLRKDVGDLFAPNEMTNHFAWLFEKTILLQNVFRKHFKDFKAQPGQEPEPHAGQISAS
jgi:hypothetical protein